MPFQLRGPKGGLLIRRAGASRVAKALPGLVKRFRKVTVTQAPAIPIMQRPGVVKWARWGAANEPAIHYTESAARDDWLTGKPGKLPMSTDCSGFVTACYKWAGCPDPNGMAYKQLGYTGTLLAHAKVAGHLHTNVAAARPGDLIVIGPGTGDHVVVVVEQAADPLVVSHGFEGGPRVQRLSVDGRTPKRVCVTLS